MYSGIDGFHGAFEVEMDIGNEWNADLREDFGKGFGVFAFGDGDADEICTGSGEFVDFSDAGVDIISIARGHGLDGDGGITAYFDTFVGIIAYDDLTGFSALNHGLRYFRCIDYKDCNGVAILDMSGGFYKCE